MSSLQKLTLNVTILRAEGLVGKDRKLFSKTKTSDPYVQVRVKKNHLGSDKVVYKTEVKPKTLEPTWNESFQVIITPPKHILSSSSSSLSSSQPITLESLSTIVQLDIYDHDVLSDPDLMGKVVIFPPKHGEMQRITQKHIETTQWYDIPPDSAKNASGRIQVKIEMAIETSRNLERGNVFELSNANGSTMYPYVQMGLSWDSHADLDVSCVAITTNGEISLPDTVYYANTSNSNRSVLHSGDARDGYTNNNNSNTDDGNFDESLTFCLNRIPPYILAMYVVLTVATPNQTLKQATMNESGRPTSKNPLVTVRVPSTSSTEGGFQTLCTFSPNNITSEDATAMFVLRLEASSPPGEGEREGGAAAPAPFNPYQPSQPSQQYPKRDWKITPIQDTHPTARSFGNLIPHLKSYTRDLLPDIVVDPTEQVAILRNKGDAIRLKQYSPSHCHGSIPECITLGLSWDITHGRNIDLDASIVCLDKDLACIDQIWWRQLHSLPTGAGEGAIRHHGDEREGDAVGDDEKIDLYLNKINPQVQYIGFNINSFSGQELDDVARASCHLFEKPQGVTATTGSTTTSVSQEICSYAMTDASSLNGYTALVLGCLYRVPTLQKDDGENKEATADSEWCLCIIAEAAQGKTVHDNVDELQNYLRDNPPKPPSSKTGGVQQGEEDEIVVEAEEEEVVVDSFMPAFVPMEEEEIDLSS